MFGAASLAVLAADEDELFRVLDQLEGNLTGTIYTAAGPQSPRDPRLFTDVAERLRPKVGRLIVNKMPTGVLVSPAMVHGGPFPSTSHPGFTAVGIPASIRRFAMLQCFDQYPLDQLPEALRDENPTGSTWRWIDGRWTCDSL
jgi:NADP-dependent aldehyde dehydrogenase